MRARADQTLRCRVWQGSCVAGEQGAETGASEERHGGSTDLTFLSQCIDKGPNAEDMVAGSDVPQVPEKIAY